MANLLRIEPSKFCENEAWYIFDNGCSYLRPIDAGEDAPRGPMIISDHIDACVSHADGKTYESKRALAASYLPSGNPQGIRYECIGEKVAKPFERQRASKEDRMRAVTRTLDQMGI